MVKIAALFTVACAAMAAPALWHADGVPLSTWAISLALGLVLTALSVIDFESLRLPDVLTLPLAVAGLLVTWLLVLDDVVWRALAGLGAFLLLFALAQIFRRLRGVDALGLGDAKLFAAAGTWVGYAGLASVLLLASLSALAAAAVAALAGASIDRDTRIPFGPFLAVGLWLTWLYGPHLLL